MNTFIFTLYISTYKEHGEEQKSRNSFSAAHTKDPCSKYFLLVPAEPNLHPPVTQLFHLGAQGELWVNSVIST